MPALPGFEILMFHLCRLLCVPGGTSLTSGHSDLAQTRRGSSPLRACCRKMMPASA